MTLLGRVHEFEWDSGNKDKNWTKHRVSHEECEEAFFDPHKRILDTSTFIGLEKRHLLIGSAKNGRILFVVFVLRKDKIRVISARDLNRKERGLYEKKP